MPRAKQDLRRVNVWLPMDLAEWLFSEAERNGVPMSAYLTMRLREIQRQDDMMNRGLPQAMEIVEAVKRAERAGKNDWEYVRDRELERQGGRSREG